MNTHPMNRRDVLQTLTAGGLAAAVIATSSSSEATAAPKHRKIKEALEALKDARVELKEAGHNFGGHRVKALEAVDAAIEQLRKALAFAD